MLAASPKEVMRQPLGVPAGTSQSSVAAAVRSAVVVPLNRAHAMRE
jgi:hypothetical protein